MKKSVGSQSNLPLNNSSMNSIKSTNNSNNSIHHSLGKIRTLSNTSFQSNEDGRENNISSSNQSLNISTTNISASTNTCISPIGPDGRLKLQESQREELRDLIQGQKLAQNDVDIEMTSYHNHEINEKTKFDSVASLTNEKNEQFNTTSNLMATVTAISPTMIMPTVSLSEPQYVFSQPSNLLLPEKYSSMDFLPLQPQIKEDDGQEVNSSIHPSIPVNLNEHQRIHLSELELELQQQRHLEEVQQTLQKIALSQKGPHIDVLDCRFMAEDMSELTTCAEYSLRSLNRSPRDKSTILKEMGSVLADLSDIELESYLNQVLINLNSRRRQELDDQEQHQQFLKPGILPHQSPLSVPQVPVQAQVHTQSMYHQQTHHITSATHNGSQQKSNSFNTNSYSQAPPSPVYSVGSQAGHSWVSGHSSVAGTGSGSASHISTVHASHAQYVPESVPNARTRVRSYSAGNESMIYSHTNVNTCIGNISFSGTTSLGYNNTSFETKRTSKSVHTVAPSTATTTTARRSATGSVPSNSHGIASGIASGHSFSTHSSMNNSSTNKNKFSFSVNTSGENNLPKRHGIFTARTPDRPKKHSLLLSSSTTTKNGTSNVGSHTPTAMRTRHSSYDAAEDEIGSELALPLTSPVRTPLSVNSTNHSTNHHHTHSHGYGSHTAFGSTNHSSQSTNHSFNTMLKSPSRYSNAHSSTNNTPVDGRNNGNMIALRRSPHSASTRNSLSSTNHYPPNTPTHTHTHRTSTNTTTGGMNHMNMNMSVGASSPQLNTGRNLQSDKMFRNSMYGNMPLSPMSPTYTTSSSSPSQFSYSRGLPSPVAISSETPLAGVLIHDSVIDTTSSTNSVTCTGTGTGNSATAVAAVGTTPNKRYVKPRGVKPARVSSLTNQSTYNDILSSEEFSYASSGGTSLVSSHHSAFKMNSNFHH